MNQLEQIRYILHPEKKDKSKLYVTEELSEATCEKLEILHLQKLNLSFHVILEPVITTFIEISPNELVEPFGMDEEDNATVGFSPVKVHVNVFEALYLHFQHHHI